MLYYISLKNLIENDLPINFYNIKNQDINNKFINEINEYKEKHFYPKEFSISENEFKDLVQNGTKIIL
jgi:hypothetical protein